MPLKEAQIPFKIHIVKDHDMKERLCLEVERLGLSAVIMGSRGGEARAQCRMMTMVPVLVVLLLLLLLLLRIKKVFGASNVSRLLVHLPLSDRCKAAMSISYEAQARIQDPIYGCVSHIFALQQQVVDLQAQLAFLKDQAAQSWFHELENSSNYMPQFNSTHINNPGTTSGNGMNTCHNSIQPTSYYENEIMNSNNSVNGGYENSIRQWDEYNRQWGFQDADELQSVVSSYMHN